MTLAMLSWKAKQTLRNTLESYQRYGLDKLDDEKVIFFQEISKEDRAIAKEFGYDCFGSPDNIGIAEAYKLLVAYASGDAFLFLENDWELLSEPVLEIAKARYLLGLDDASFPLLDVARLRSRKNPGAPLWSRQYEGNEQAAPQFLLDAVYWKDNPAELEGIIDLHIDWYFAFASNANWTNNPTMFRTEWLRENIVSRMEDDVEKSIQAWWQTQNFIVGQGEGLFTHTRLDR